MKSSFRKLTLRTLGVVSLLATGGMLSAQNLVWGPDGSGPPTGGTGLWNLTGLLWTADDGGSYQAWPGSSGAQAIFGGTGGTVTVGENVQAEKLLFTTDGYVLQGGTIRLSTSSQRVTITARNAEDTVTINSDIRVGAGDLAINGPGTVNIGGNISFDTWGNLAISNATTRLMLSSSAPSLSFSYLIFGGSTSNEGGGGSLTIDNTGATGNTSISFNYGTYTYYGDSTVRSNRVADYNMSMYLGQFYTIAKGSTLNLEVVGGVNGVNNTIQIGGGTGFLGAGVFSNGSDFGWVNNGPSYHVRGINYGVDSGSATTSGGAILPTATHVQMTGAITAQTTATLQTLKIAGANDLNILAGQTVSANAILKAGGNSSTISGGTIKTTTASRDLVVRTDLAEDSLTISSVIADNAGSSLTKSGLGTLFLSGANTYTGSTYLGGGIVSVSSVANNNTAQALGQGSLEFSQGTLRYTGTGSETTNKNGQTHTGGGVIDVSNASATLTMTGAIRGIDSSLPSDYLVKDGAGTLVLGGSTDNGGLGVTVKNGKLILAKSSSYFLHAVNYLAVESGGTVQLAGTGEDQIHNKATVAMNGTWDFNGHNEGISHLNGAGTITNTAAGTTSILQFYAENGAPSSNFAGSITDGAGRMAVAYNSGQHILTGENTYTGGTTLGTNTSLQIGDGGMTGSLVSNVAVVYGSTIIFNRDGTSEYTGAISGMGQVNIVGPGTVIFSGANTYTGDTTISSGTLLVNGSVQSRAVVETGGKLAGTGLMGQNSLVKDGGQIGADDSVGTLTFQNGLSLEGDVTLSYQLGTVSDVIRVSGGLFNTNDTTSITLDITAMTGFAVGSYTLIDLAGSLGAWTALDHYTLGLTPEGYNYELQLTSTQLVLVVSAVPEPSTVGILIVGLCTVLFVARRRRSVWL